MRYTHDAGGSSCRCRAADTETLSVLVETEAVLDAVKAAGMFFTALKARTLLVQPAETSENQLFCAQMW